MLKEKLLQDFKEAMKEKEVLKKNVVQMIRAAILQVEKDKQIELNDYKENEITIDSTKDSELVILNNNNILNMTINLLDSSTLIINELQEDYQNNKIITINIYNNSTLIYNLSNITKNGSNTQIKINFK